MKCVLDLKKSSPCIKKSWPCIIERKCFPSKTRTSLHSFKKHFVSFSFLEKLRIWSSEVSEGQQRYSILHLIRYFIRIPGKRQSNRCFGQACVHQSVSHTPLTFLHSNPQGLISSQICYGTQNGSLWSSAVSEMLTGPEKPSLMWALHLVHHTLKDGDCQFEFRNILILPRFLVPYQSPFPDHIRPPDQFSCLLGLLWCSDGKGWFDPHKSKPWTIFQAF